MNTKRRQLYPLLGSLCLLLLLNYGQLIAQNNPQQIKQGETPQGLQAPEWVSIKKQIQMGKYKAYPQPNGAYTSANLVHGFQIGYAPSGKTSLSPRDCQQADYHVALQLQGVGYEELSYLNRPVEITQEDLGTAAGSKVTYQWNNNLREWWINDEKGLEQWFSLQEAPQGRRAGKPLRLRMALQTDMQVSLQNNRLTLRKGSTTLHYDKLRVWDATGKEMEAEMQHSEGYIDLYIAEARAVYPLTIDPTWTQQAYLKASNTGTFDNFGYSVAISGETLVVGAPYEGSNATGVNGNQADNSAMEAGAAYVFVRSGNTWKQQAYLKAGNTGAEDNFGASVAISGETVVVGAPREDSNAIGINGDQEDNRRENAGAAYIFVRSGSTWTQQAYLKAADYPDEDDKFGASVAISGETVVVGAPGESSAFAVVSVKGSIRDDATWAGAAYVFVRSGKTWTQEAVLKSSAAAYDEFGTSVAISGQRVVVGAPYKNSKTGYAFVFVRNGKTWTEEAFLKGDKNGSDRFGYSVAISGETLVVGAPYEDSNATGVNGNQANNDVENAGAAYVFVRNGDTWTQQAYLKASNTGKEDYFGNSVAISGQTVVVGAPNEDSNAMGVNGNQANNNVEDAGAAYIFVRNGNTWTQQAYLKASNTGSGDNFGASVAISGETVAVGAPYEGSNATGINGNQADNNANRAGAMYIFLVK